MNIEDNWNTAVIALATNGGYVMDYKNKKLLCIMTVNSSDVSKNYQKMTITNYQMGRLMKEVAELKRELLEMEIEKAAAKETKKKTRNTRSPKTTTTRRKKSTVKKSV